MAALLYLLAVLMSNLNALEWAESRALWLYDKRDDEASFAAITPLYLLLLQVLPRQYGNPVECAVLPALKRY